MLRPAVVGANVASEHPRPKTLTPAPLPPPPHPPHRERGPGWSGLAFLPLLPVRGVRRGREKRAGVMRVLGGGRDIEGFTSSATLFVLTMLLLLAAPAQAEELRGHGHLLAKGAKSPDRLTVVRQAVVFYEPAFPQPVRSPAEP